MSGSIIGGVVGAVIGFIYGGPSGAAYGWALGSAAGGLLMPEKIEGPRLQDLRPQSSEYGRPIPITYGTIALGGNVIWASDLVEVESESGGKGGPEVSNYAYFANFAVAVCEGEVSLGRIWAGPEKRLIWDGATLEGAESGATLRWYTGSETQEPDPLIESYMGAGMVPAYRGTAYLVMENFPVAKDGNRIPFLTIEVGGTAEPERLGYVWPHSVWIDDSTIILAHSAGGGGVVIAGQDDPHTFVASHQFEGFTWDLDQTTYDPDLNKLVGFSTAGPAFTLMAMANGAETQTMLDQPTGLVTGLSPRGASPADAAYHQGLYLFLTHPGTGTYATLYGVDPNTLATVFVYVYTNLAGSLSLEAPADASAMYVLAVSDSEAWKLPIPALAGSSDQTAISLGAVATAYSGSNGLYHAVDPTTGYLWTARRDGTGSTQLYISVHDPVTATQLTNTVVTLAYGIVALGISFAGSKVFVFGQRSFLSDHFVEFDGSTYAYVTEHPGVYHSAAPPKLMAYDADRNLLMAFRDAFEYGTVAETVSGNIVPGALPFSTWEIGQQDGQVLLTSTTLDQIVLDLHLRSDLAEVQADVTALEDDLVNGYGLANQMEIKAAIDALRPAFFFDAVESVVNGVPAVKYVKRGGIAAEIADDDLGAYESGSQAPDPLETTRLMDEELPANLNVRYISEPTKYDLATKLAKRLVGNSGTEVTIDLPIVMSDTKAQQVAEVNLHGPWVGRLTYRFSLPRKYAYLEPTDIIAAGGYTMRIVTIKQTDGRYQVEAVHDDANVYTPHVVVTETVPPPQVVETVSPTLLELM